jgi:hypothetical protein
MILRAVNVRNQRQVQIYTTYTQLENCILHLLGRPGSANLINFIIMEGRFLATTNDSININIMLITQHCKVAAQKLKILL